ncbi:MAG TPA: sulfite exporter TauE/SafE family protein [Symbiobacteriaceae bacterium]|nr:sulfite exporter TauE/SafE family protein [Symbiobacteriaceae bacterium]
MTTFALTALLVTLGSVVSGMAGFGFGIAVMPFMLMLYPPKVAVCLTPVISLGGLFLQWTRVRRDADPFVAKHLVIGAVLGIPLGVFLLVAINPLQVKLLVGLAVVVAIIAQVTTGKTEGPALRPGRWLTLAGGFGGGLLASTVGQPGIPVGLLMAWTRLDKTVVRGTMVTFLVVTQLVAVINLFLQKVLSPSVLGTGFLLMPFYLLGLSIGNKGFKVASQGLYRRLLLGLLTVSAVTGVVNGISALLS